MSEIHCKVVNSSKNQLSERDVKLKTDSELCTDVMIYEIKKENEDSDEEDKEYESDQEEKQSENKNNSAVRLQAIRLLPKYNCITSVDSDSSHSLPTAFTYKMAEDENDYGFKLIKLPVDFNINGPTDCQPSTENYDGPCDFQVNVSCRYKSERGCAYEYSSSLNKVFIDLGKALLIEFKVNPKTVPISQGFCVRAVLVYVTPDHRSEPVERCVIHWFKSDPQHIAHEHNTSTNEEKCHCENHELVGHVITTSVPNAVYDYNPKSMRHSVLVSIEPTHPGFNVTQVSYRFNCKTSCQGGMGRRPVMIIFTLENSSGEVWGRKNVLLKVCSCPKRDKEREEDFERKPKGVATEIRKAKHHVDQDGMEQLLAKKTRVDSPRTQQIINQDKESEQNQQQEFQCNNNVVTSLICYKAITSLSQQLRSLEKKIDEQHTVLERRIIENHESLEKRLKEQNEAMVTKMKKHYQIVERKIKKEIEKKLRSHHETLDNKLKEQHDELKRITNKHHDTLDRSINNHFATLHKNQ